MEFLSKDDLLFDRIINIRDSEISAIRIFMEEHELFIEIDFTYFDKIATRLRFSDIREYSFYHNKNYHFRYVENFNLLKLDGLFYFTFDPEIEGATTISENDQDFILFGHFKAYSIDPITKQ